MPIRQPVPPGEIEVSAPIPEAKIYSFPNNINILRPASPSHRLAAFVVDFALLYGTSLWFAQWLGIFMLRAILAKKATASGIALSPQLFQYSYQYAVNIILPITVLFLGFTYYLSFLHLWGATLGKGLFGLRVVTRLGETPSLEKAGKRFIASVFTLFSGGLFFVLGAYSRDGLCFHDEASGTRVVYRLGVERVARPIARAERKKNADAITAEPTDISRAA